METVIAHPKKVASETKKTSFGPIFIAEVLEAEKARKEAEKPLRVEVENLWK